VGGNRIDAEGNVEYTETHNHYYEAFEELHRRSFRTTGREQRSWRFEQIIPPPNLERHLDALREHRILVLAGGRRTGLTTTAAHRWHEFAERHRLETVVLTATDDRELKDELERLDESLVLLLDISHNPEFEKELPERLAELQKTLEKHDRYIVIAVAEHSPLRLPEDLEEAAFTPTRLSPTWVFDRFFARRREEFSEVLRSREFRERLDAAWPPLARTMAEMINGAEPDLTPAKFFKRLHHELGHAPEALRKMLRWQLDATGRSMLISASLLDGSSPQVLTAAAEGLLAQQDEDASEPRNFDRFSERGTGQKVEMIQEVFKVDGLSFRDAAVGDAVLPYVWDEYPASRASLQRWLDELLALPDYLTSAALPMLPARLFEFAASTGEASLILDRIPAMAESVRLDMRQMAAALLAAGAISTDIGQAVRSRLYSWSLSASEPLQLVVIAACAHGDYLTLDPRTALVRLRHLAASEHEFVRTTAHRAVLNAWNYLLPTAFLEFLGDCLRRRDKVLHRAVLKLLIEICGDKRMRADLQQHAATIVADRRGLVHRFWKLLFDRATPSETRRAVRAWVSVAAELPEPLGDAMAASLAAAAAENHRRLGQLTQAVAAAPFEGAGNHRERELPTQLMRRLIEIEVPL
jgi:hypothetical protein